MIFVVDACVAHAVGGLETTDPISKNCREILMEIFLKSHEIAISSKIIEEYNNDHTSNFFKEWYSDMVRKSCVKFLNKNNPELLNKIKRKICSSKNKDREAIYKIVIKDAHLLETALAADKFIISNDIKARKHIVQLIKNDNEKLGINLVIWVATEDILINWLKKGANNNKIPRRWNLAST